MVVLKNINIRGSLTYQRNQVQNLIMTAMAGNLDHLKNVGFEVVRYKFDHI